MTILVAFMIAVCVVILVVDVILAFLEEDDDEV
jgi:hypothetical protein